MRMINPWRMREVGRSVGRSVGQSVGRSVGRSLTSCIGENGTHNHLPHAKAFGNKHEYC